VPHHIQNQTIKMAEEPKAIEQASPVEETKHSVLNSKFPVLLPYSDKLFISDREFANYISSLPEAKPTDPAINTTISQTDRENGSIKVEYKAESAPFQDALLKEDAVNHDNYTLADENKMLTHNVDVAFKSTKSPLVDLFSDLSEGYNAEDVAKTIATAWEVDPLVTLKIIFNARSIHLGKASRNVAYNALGWLYEHHTQTLLANLVWLVRPVMEKKAPKNEDKKDNGDTKGAIKAEEDEDFEMVDEPVLDSREAPAGANTVQHDLKNGVTHGYWKDLLNM
jgi:hypothetical protein